MFAVATEILGREMFHGDSCKLPHKRRVPTKTRDLAFNELLNNELFSSAFTCLIENYLESKNITFLCCCSSVFPGGPSGKNPPAMQETWVRSLGGEDPLETEKATHSSVLAWRIPWPEEPGGLAVHGVAKSRTQLK